MDPSPTVPAIETPRFPRHLLRRLEDATSFPLVSLQAICEARDYLDDQERRAITQARVLGAGVADIAASLRITRQGAHYKLKKLGLETTATRGDTEEPHGGSVPVL